MSDSVKCNDCGTEFEIEKNENKDGRTPCPKCGSTKRHISLKAKGAIFFTGSVSATLTVVSNVNLLLQTLIIPG